MRVWRSGEELCLLNFMLGFSRVDWVLALEVTHISLELFLISLRTLKYLSLRTAGIICDLI